MASKPTISSFHYLAAVVVLDASTFSSVRNGPVKSMPLSNSATGSRLGEGWASVAYRQVQELLLACKDDALSQTVVSPDLGNWERGQ